MSSSAAEGNGYRLSERHSWRKKYRRCFPRCPLKRPDHDELSVPSILLQQPPAALPLKSLTTVSQTYIQLSDLDETGKTIKPTQSLVIKSEAGGGFSLLNSSDNKPPCPDWPELQALNWSEVAKAPLSFSKKKKKKR